jgi:hypothetical protein
VSALVQRGVGSVEVPLDIETRSAPQFVSLEHNPGQFPEYTVQVRQRGGLIRISPHPEQAGPSRVYVTCFDLIGDIRPMDGIVVTAAAADGLASQRPVQRLEDNTFVADVQLQPGRNRITVIVRALDGTRLRAAVDLDVPKR